MPFCPARRPRALALLSLLGAAAAQNADLAAPLGEPPLSAAKGVVTVFATISYNKCNAINVVSATFYADYYIVFSWRDDRMIGRDTPPDDLWFIDPERINSAADTTVTLDPSTISVTNGAPAWLNGTLSPAERGGAWIVAGARLTGTLDGAFNLAEFPFDDQSVRIIIESKDNQASTLVWAFPRDLAAQALPYGFEIDGWQILGVEPSEATQRYAALFEDYSRLTIGINLRRRPTYFVSK